jgi:hypothetical protein
MLVLSRSSDYFGERAFHVLFGEIWSLGPLVVCTIELFDNNYLIVLAFVGVGLPSSARVKLVSLCH